MLSKHVWKDSVLAKFIQGDQQNNRTKNPKLQYGQPSPHLSFINVLFNSVSNSDSKTGMSIWRGKAAYLFVICSYFCPFESYSIPHRDQIWQLDIYSL